jgi:endonuclease III
MDTIIYLLIGNICISIFAVIYTFLSSRSKKAVDADMAQACKNLMQYLQKEFDLNLTTHENLQKWNEQNLQLIIDKCDLLEADEKYTHQFLSRIALGLGLQRSNLEDV